MAQQENIGIVLIARMDSSRLPGKALADVCGQPLIGRVLERICGCAPIVLATTARTVDDPLAAWAESQGVQVHRDSGQTNDVAGRLVRAASAAGLDWAFRLNADSPLVEHSLFLKAMEFSRDAFDLITNLAPRSYPYGVAVELVRVRALADLIEQLDTDEREHVTLGLYRRLAPERIRPVGGGHPEWVDLRATIDTAEDLEWFRRFIQGHHESWPITPLSAVVASGMARRAA